MQAPVRPRARAQERRDKPRAGARVEAPASFLAGLLVRAFHRRDPRRDLGLDRFEIEARAALHRRELDEGLGVFADLLLQEDEAPEFMDEEITHISERAVVALLESHPLERVEPQVGEDRHSRA